MLLLKVRGFCMMELHGPFVDVKQMRDYVRTCRAQYKPEHGFDGALKPWSFAVEHAKDLYFQIIRIDGGPKEVISYYE